jgi:hypothetical protein
LVDALREDAAKVIESGGGAVVALLELATAAGFDPLLTGSVYVLRPASFQRALNAVMPGSSGPVVKPVEFPAFGSKIPLFTLDWGR